MSLRYSLFGIPANIYEFARRERERYGSNDLLIFPELTRTRADDILPLLFYIRVDLIVSSADKARTKRFVRFQQQASALGSLVDSKCRENLQRLQTNALEYAAKIAQQLAKRHHHVTLMLEDLTKYPWDES